MTAGSRDSGDFYARRLASPEYRRSREAKAEVIARILGDRLTAAERIADIGTGTGIIKKMLEEKTHKAIVGFEIDIPFVIERERVVAADACRLPVADGTFDLLILNHIYEHVEDPRAMFAEAARVLAPGGCAYVSAGSRWAVIEPHYRLPFLSWLPRRLADAYLRTTGRGAAYEGVTFLGYAALKRVLAAPGIAVRDVTEEALGRLLDAGGASVWRAAWRVLRKLPGPARRTLLRASPQWFFILEKEAGEGTGVSAHE